MSDEPPSVLLIGPAVVKAGYDAMVEDHRLLSQSIKENASLRSVGVERAADASLVLFVGSRDLLKRDVMRHPVARKWRRKSFLYDSEDSVIPLLPGVFPSVRASRFRPGWTKGGFYLRHSDNPFITASAAADRAAMLFGFVGAVETHSVRHGIVNLVHERAILRDSSRDPGRGYGQTAAVYEAYKQGYAEDLASCKFVLCPRGYGPSSMRIFEAMKAARVPVIISDEWVPPDGPEWPRFSLRVPEGDVREIPRLLEARERNAPTMGIAARAAWDRWFSPHAAATTLVHWCSELARSRVQIERSETWRARAELLTPRNLRVRLSLARRELALLRQRRALGESSGTSKRDPV
jgi:hypothetical protein